MENTCRRAIEIGLPAIAFTDHCDFVHAFAEQRPLDFAGYLEAVERCRGLFPELRILSGVELGEPHRFPAEVEAMLGNQPLDRVLASVHTLRLGGEAVDLSQGILTVEDAAALFRDYLAETLELVRSDQGFDVLAHIDYPKRYWPSNAGSYDDHEFEEAIRAVLKAAVKRDLVLEVNTTRGNVLCPGEAVLTWWREAGGRAVSFGSDAHDPARIAAGFEAAAQMVEAAGFKPAAEPTALWRR